MFWNMASEPATQIARPGTEGRTYCERKLARGKTKREGIRSPKRPVSDRI